MTRRSTSKLRASALIAGAVPAALALAVPAAAHAAGSSGHAAAPRAAGERDVNYRAGSPDSITANNLTWKNLDNSYYLSILDAGGANGDIAVAYKSDTGTQQHWDGTVVGYSSIEGNSLWTMKNVHSSKCLDNISSSPEAHVVQETCHDYMGWIEYSMYNADRVFQGWLLAEGGIQGIMACEKDATGFDVLTQPAISLVDNNDTNFSKDEKLCIWH